MATKHFRDDVHATVHLAGSGVLHVQLPCDLDGFHYDLDVEPSLPSSNSEPVDWFAVDVVHHGCPYRRWFGCRCNGWQAVVHYDLRGSAVLTYAAYAR